MPDPYKTLGIASNASAEEIRTAYRGLAKKHHPDLNPGNAKAEERFKAVAAANEILSDPIKRGQFDRGEIDAQGQNKPTSAGYRDFAEGADGHRYSANAEQGWAPEDLEAMFGSVFGRGRGKESRPRRGSDQDFSLTITFMQSFAGATCRLVLPDGRALDVKIPVGAESGQVLRLRGQGGMGRQGGNDGDAMITLVVSPDPRFRRLGQDVELVLPVTFREAVLGASIDIATPAGEVRMTVPPRSDNGTRLRLRGRGMPAHNSQPKGDLFAVVKIVLGPVEPPLEEFLRSWVPASPINPRAETPA